MLHTFLFWCLQGKRQGSQGQKEWRLPLLWPHLTTGQVDQVGEKGQSQVQMFRDLNQYGPGWVVCVGVCLPLPLRFSPQKAGNKMFSRELTYQSNTFWIKVELIV